MHLSLLKNAANRLTIMMVHPSIILHKVSLHKIYLDLLKISPPIRLNEYLEYMGSPRAA